MNDDSIFVLLTLKRGKLFDGDYYYEKEKGTLKKVSFFMNLILKLRELILLIFYN